MIEKKTTLRIVLAFAVTGFVSLSAIGLLRSQAVLHENAGWVGYTLILDADNGKIGGAYGDSASGATNSSAKTALGNPIGVYYVDCRAQDGYYAQINEIDGYLTNATAISGLASITVTGNGAGSDKPLLSWGATADCSAGELTIDQTGEDGVDASQTVAVSGSYFKLSSGYAVFSCRSIGVEYTCVAAASSSSSSGSSSSSSASSDPYAGIDTNAERQAYYESGSYAYATSYEDAQLRSRHGLVSGSIDSQDYLTPTVSSSHMSGSSYKRLSDSVYTYTQSGGYESYKIRNPDGSVCETIYYGGAYGSMNEVAAYMLAFAEVPPNMGYSKSSTSSNCPAGSTWWKFGRVNYGSFSGPGDDRYTYEPAFPGMALYPTNGGTATSDYYEADFGDWAKYNNEDYVNKPASPYYDLSDGSISRGVLRFVFIGKYKSASGTRSVGTTVDGVNAEELTDINKRYVFYTYDHYGDFQEYLNYAGGWGKRFGSMTAGNDDPEGTTFSPTPYPQSVLSSLAAL